MFGPTTYRLQWRRRLTRRYKVIAVGLVGMLFLAYLIPAGISTHPAPIITGHSSFYHGDEFDPCLAAVVGIMRLRVLWFNDQVLVERYNGDGAYIYATENGAPDPRDEDVDLIHSGVFYDFVDPNGVLWHVDEAYYDEIDYDRTGAGPVVGNVIRPDGSVQADVGFHAEYKAKRWFTWIVAVGTPVRDKYPGADDHDFYNFVDIVNTCKFRKENLPNSTNPQNNGTVQHDAVNNTAQNGHFKDDGDHTHESYLVNLWVGKQPQLLPVGTTTPWEAAATANATLRGGGSAETDEGDEFNDE